MSYPNPRMNQLFRLEYPQSVGVYGTYDEAQRVVDFLADARFPVENLCIVGTELRSIERVLGRRSWGTVLGAGVQSGLSTALIVTVIMALFGQGENLLGLFLTALVIGIVIGVLMSAFGYWMSRGRRDFRSVSQTMATKYEVLAEHKVANQARDLINTMPGARAAQFDPRLTTPQPSAGYPTTNQPSQPGGYPTAGYQPGGSDVGQEPTPSVPPAPAAPPDGFVDPTATTPPANPGDTYDPADPPPPGTSQKQD